MPWIHLVQLLATELDLPELSWDASGTAAIAFGSLVVWLSPGPSDDPVESGLSLRAHLGSLDSLPPEAAVTLMAGNRWPDERIAGVLGVDERRVVFLLHHFQTHPLSIARLGRTLHRFAAHAMHWREWIARAHEPATTSLLGQLRA
jgi:hypothetical protein